MEKRKRRAYTQEFKDEAVKLAGEQGYSIAEAGRNLGIYLNVLGRLKRSIQGIGKDGDSLGGRACRTEKASQREQEAEAGA